MITIEKCNICGSKNFKSFLELKDYFLSEEKFYITECKDCGFKFTNPYPDENHISSYYKSEKYVSHSNTKKGIFFKLYHLVKKNAINSKKRLIESYVQKGRILDYGCGTGDFLSAFISEHWDCYGIEPDDNTRLYASEKHKLPINKPNDLTIFEDCFFDVISMWHVLEHIPDLNTKLRQLRTLLKPNGIIVIAVPNSDSYDARYYGNYWAAFDVPRHLHHFNHTSLTALLEKNEFEILSRKPMHFDSFYVSILSEKYKKSFLSFFKGIAIGLFSNFMASQKNLNYSSIIYIIRKKP
ncbi:MAG: class I SAM-dependent methyltransferase [Bacteroidales bacterium]|nr:class I SAM-dependent methyltransferase [Bacteroidales bacterium]